MDTDKLADAILKLTEVHDRRLGEIGAALNKIGRELSVPDPITDQYETGIVKLSQAVDNLGAEIAEAANIMRPDEED